MKPEHVPTCRSCGAEIRFVRLDNDQVMPVDRAPNEELGNVLVERGTATVISSSTQLVAVRADGRELYVSHFATCPNAGRHRRRPSRSTRAMPEELGQGALFA